MSCVHNAGTYSGRRDFWFSTFPQGWQVSEERLLHAVVVPVLLSATGERQKTGEDKLLFFVSTTLW